MTPAQFKKTQEVLGWSSARTAHMLGIGDRAVFQFRAGDRAVSGPVERLMMLYAYVHRNFPIQARERLYAVQSFIQTRDGL